MGDFDFNLAEPHFGEVVEQGECAFCDSPVPVFNEGTLVGKYQILVERGTAFIVCEECFVRAAQNAGDNLALVAGVATIYAHA